MLDPSQYSLLGSGSTGSSPYYLEGPQGGSVGSDYAGMLGSSGGGGGAGMMGIIGQLLPMLSQMGGAAAAQGPSSPSSDYQMFAASQRGQGRQPIQMDDVDAMMLAALIQQMLQGGR